MPLPSYFHHINFLWETRKLTSRSKNFEQIKMGHIHSSHTRKIYWNRKEKKKRLFTSFYIIKQTIYNDLFVIFKQNKLLSLM